jgi:hypothetical protein
LTSCALSMSANLDLRPEGQTDSAIEQAKLINTGGLILSRAVNCSAPGIFPIDCTNYRVCYQLMPGEFLGAEGKCLNDQNFNPYTLQCELNYECTTCTREGFMCLTNTSFTLCSDALEVIVNNVTCPYNHRCHEAYRLPCIKQTPTPLW